MSVHATQQLIQAIQLQHVPGIKQALKEGAVPFASYDKKTAWDAVINHESLLASLGNKDPELTEAILEMSQINPVGFDQIQMSIRACKQAQESAVFRAFISESVTERLVDAAKDQNFGGVKIKGAVNALSEGANFVKKLVSKASVTYDLQSIGVTERALINRQFFELNQPQSPKVLQQIKAYAKAMVESAPISSSGYMAFHNIDRNRIEKAISGEAFANVLSIVPSFQQLLEQRRPQSEALTASPALKLG